MEFDWDTLEELRASYLDGSAGSAGDYWKSDSLLRGYDATFARRIAWKWQWVLLELERRGWSPPPGTLVDYGCGTGVAAREVLEKYSGAGLTQAALYDRSPRALKFATETVRREFPGVTVEARLPAATGLLLVSHVLPELDEAGTAELLKLAESAQAVIFVEPGTREVSRRLIDLRQKLSGVMKPVAPCFHSGQCGLLTPENDRHWCHFFAPAPNVVYTDSDWVHFGRIMGIDLRSLPLSFLVMDRRQPAPAPGGTVRVLGKPRLYKGYVLFQGCDAGGVEEKRLMKRTDPQYFRAAHKYRTSTVQRWETEGTEIKKVEEPDSQ
jgi:hypothetical protein